MNILLINPVNRPEAKPQYFPLGLAYIAAVLENCGCEVDILDINAYRYSDDIVTRMIRRSTHDVFALTGMLTEYREIRNLAKLIRDHHPARPILLGGGLGTLMSDIILKRTEVDLVVRGEGEETIRELAGIDFDLSRAPDIKGVSLRRNGEFLNTERRSVISNLDGLPLPARHLFPYDIYFENMRGNWMFERSYRATNIITSRGCPYSCTYCDQSLWGRRFRQRSPKNILAELQQLKNSFGIEAFVLSDDTYSIRHQWVNDFCDVLIESNLQMDWMCNSRVNLVNPDMLHKMRRANCVTIGFGLESGNNDILQEMNKKTTRSQADTALTLAKIEGFRVLTYLIIGSFSETKESVMDTVNLLKKHDQNGGFNFLTPIPGTALYHEAVRRGKLCNDREQLLENWDKWQDRMMVNLTDRLSDAELKKLKSQGERILNSPWKRLGRYYRSNGLRATLNAILRQLQRKLDRTTYRAFSAIAAAARLRYANANGSMAIDPDKITRVLIVKLYGIGNGLLALPMLEETRQRFPNAKISLLAEERSKDVFSHLQWIDNFIYFPQDKGNAGLFKLTCQIVRMRPQVILSTFPMTNNTLAKLYAFTGARVIVGHTIDERNRNLYTHPMNYDVSRHEVQLNLDLLTPFGGKGTESEINFPLPDRIRKTMSRVWSDSVPAGKRTVGFHCGSYLDMPQKRYPENKFAEVANKLSAAGLQVILFGGPGEELLGRKIASRMHRPLVNFIGGFSLLETAALIERCNAMVSNDSGLMHVAASVKTPVLGLFGPTRPEKNAPWGTSKKARYIQSDRYCTGCHTTGMPILCLDNQCMKSIRIDDIVFEIFQLLEIPAEGPAMQVSIASKKH
jgi:anaerobic magnesium-protoporphyrin IX monomethyl ester cyclase